MLGDCDRGQQEAAGLPRVARLDSALPNLLSPGSRYAFRGVASLLATLAIRWALPPLRTTSGRGRVEASPQVPNLCGETAGDEQSKRMVVVPHRYVTRRVVLRKVSMRRTSAQVCYRPARSRMRSMPAGRSTAASSAPPAAAGFAETPDTPELCWSVSRSASRGDHGAGYSDSTEATDSREHVQHCMQRDPSMMTPSAHPT